MGLTEDIRTAVEAIQGGGTVIYPTETCYGLGGDATDPDVADRVYELKDRPRDKPLTCVVSDIEMAERYGHLDDRERRLVTELMPGPVTLVVDRKEAFPERTNPDLAFRIPDSEVAQELPRRSGVPVIATSANISGHPSSYTMDEIAPTLRDGVDAVINAGRLEDRPSSTIVDLRDGITIYREGPVTYQKIEATIDG